MTYRISCRVAAAAFISLAALSATPVSAQRAGGAAGITSNAATAEADTLALARAGDSRAIGPDSAMVVLLEFMDFTCSFCRSFHIARMDSLKRAIGSDVRLVFVNAVYSERLRSWHAAEAGICAGLASGTDGYLGMADRLYRNVDTWKNARDPGATFTRYAREAGVDTVAFNDCRARDAAAPLMLADIETANRLGIERTPTFIIAPRGATSAEQTARVSGDVPIAQLMQLITEARKKAK
ncbi:MAG TPA: thioredoxin domain-containing protein [Gemmatimonadaceae bacterium]|nr:thioredoxin domain-containing protein [Gemmatimonadaceae bacterium]